LFPSRIDIQNFLNHLVAHSSQALIRAPPFPSVFRFQPIEQKGIIMSQRKELYEFRFENNDAANRIYVRFFNAFNSPQEIEVSEELYRELEQINRSINRMHLSEKRHNEYRDLSEEEQAERGAAVVISAEEAVITILLSEQLREAFLQLPATQARRFLLVHIFGYSYREIACKEGCSVDAVKKSLVAAKKKLQRILPDWVPETPSKSTSE